MRKIVAGILTIFSVMLIPAVASAHVVVRPNEVGVGAFQTFTASVPNEKEIPVTALRIVIPSGLKEVSPTVKQGWSVTTKKSGDTVREIAWNGGTIPAGMRDDFTFSAQAPAETTTLQWKAYQTYADGTTVAWDQTPTDSKGDNEGSNSGPYSTTKVVNDLNNSSGASASTTKANNQAGAYALSGIALAIAIIALITKRK